MMSTAHVDNVCACAILAAEKSPGGRAYFVSDGKNQSMRAVLSDLLSTRGVVVKAANAPLDMAWRIATVMEFIWRTFRRSGRLLNQIPQSRYRFEFPSRSAQYQENTSASPLRCRR